MADKRIKDIESWGYALVIPSRTECGWQGVVQVIKKSGGRHDYTEIYRSLPRVTDAEAFFLARQFCLDSGLRYYASMSENG